MESYPNNTLSNCFTALPTGFISPIPAFDPSFGFHGSGSPLAAAALPTHPPSHCLLDFPRTTTAPRIEDAIIIDKQVIAAYITKIAQYEHELLQQHHEKVNWLRERQRLMERIAHLESTGVKAEQRVTQPARAHPALVSTSPNSAAASVPSETTEMNSTTSTEANPPAAAASGASHDEWATSFLQSLANYTRHASLAAPSTCNRNQNTSSEETTTSSTQRSASLPRSGTDNEADNTVPPTRATSGKRKRSPPAASDDDSTTTANEGDLEGYYTDDLSEEEYASPAKRAKLPVTAARQREAQHKEQQRCQTATPPPAASSASPAVVNQSFQIQHISQQIPVRGFSSSGLPSLFTQPAPADASTSSPTSSPSSPSSSSSATTIQGRNSFHNASSKSSLTAHQESLQHQYETTTRRGHLPDHAIRHLKQWFFSHKSHPYPSEEEKNVMMEYTGLTRGQINNWFTNARRRLLPKHDGL